VISRSDKAALAAIALWATLAPMGSILGDLPPFFVTGTGLLIGSVLALFVSRGQISKLAVPPSTLLVGVVGLFGFHAALFSALQLAPPVQANLVNYLWPLFIVVLTPLFFPGTSLRLRHVMAAIVGFAGAALAILSGGEITSGGMLGYLFALLAAIIWAGYSLLTKKLPHFESSAVGVFALVSGILALLAHLTWEAPVSPTTTQWLILMAMGFGPLGGAFYLWDVAIKTGDPQRIGLLSFLTPLLSTTLLLLVTGKQLTWLLALSGALIIGAAYFGSRSKAQSV
jgi:drug/metabolite transporter (DMT)-like permease